MKRITLFISFLFCFHFGNATVWVVNSLNDSGYGSLRAACDSALTNDTVRFNPNLLNTGSVHLILDSSIQVNKSLTIKGLYNSTDSLFIKGSGGDRLLTMSFSNKVVLDSLIMEDGISSTYGGSVFLEGIDSVQIKNSFFRNNVATNLGGAICISSYINKMMVDIENSVFFNNSTTDFNSAGGGVFISGYDVGIDVNIVRSEFYSNSSNHRGGAIHCTKDGPIYGASHIKLIDCTLNGNIAQRGAGMACDGEDEIDIHIEGSTISNNRGNLANSQGAGVFCLSYFEQAKISVYKSTFTRNGSTACLGGAMYCNSLNKWASVSVVNSTILYNEGANGGIYVKSNNGHLGELLPGGSVIALNEGNNINVNGQLKCTSLGFNVFSDVSIIGQQHTDQLGKDSLDINMPYLSFNGGVTRTLMPHFPSVAYGSGNPTDFTDAQNGKVIGVREIGAAEYCHSFFIDTVSACKSFTWINGKTYYSNNSTDKDTLVNSRGCDSIITLNLTINYADTSITRSGLSLKANALNAVYQWIDCDADTAIVDATDAEFNVTRSGNYKVEVTQNGCVDTSGCYSFINVGIVKPTVSQQLKIYPNPVHDQVNIEITNWSTNGVDVIVRDLTGKKIYTKEVEFISSQETITINMTQWAKGTYFIEVSDGKDHIIEKVVVQ